MADDINSAAKKLLDLGAALEAEIGDEGMLEIGHFGLALILTRTKAGLDADRKPFARYSPSYTEVRQESGLGIRPDLARKGDMLGAMLPKVTAPGEMSLTFANAHEAMKAAVHDGGSKKRNIPQRNFLDIRAPADVAALAEVVGEVALSQIQKVIK